MVMSIRVMRPATPNEKLEQAQLYLEAYGTSVLEQQGEKWVLSYSRSGAAVPDIRFPIQDKGSLTISYDAHRNDWSCESTLFGVPLKMEDPKLFSYNVLSMVQDRVGSKVQFISKVQEYWQRYSGDGERFASRLAREMVNTGVMSLVTDGGPVFAHFHHNFDTSFDVWFSFIAGNPILPTYRFGFYPEVAMQPFELSVAGTEEVIAILHRQASYVETFLKPLISIF